MSYDPAVLRRATARLEGERRAREDMDRMRRLMEYAAESKEASQK